MAETRQTIRQRAQRYVGTAIDATLNQAIADAHRELQRLHNYRFMEQSTAIQLADGDASFALPTDCKHPVNPEMTDAGGRAFVRMYGILKDGIVARTVDDSGRPVRYRIWNNTGHVYPKAAGAIAFAFEYVRWLPAPTDAVNTADAPAQAFLNEVYEYIERKAVAAGFRRKKNYKDADYWDTIAAYKRRELERADVNIAMANVDMQMQLPG